MEVKSSFTWGLKITAYWALCCVFNSLAHFSLVCCLCLHSYSLLLLWNLSFFADLSGDLLWTILLKTMKGKSRINKINVSLLWSFVSEPLLHSGCYIVFTVKPWWITRIFAFGIKHFQAGIWRVWHWERDRTKSVLYASHILKSLGGELDHDNAGKVCVADLFSTADLFSPLNLGANTPNPTSARGTASVNIKTGFLVVIKVLCVASASSGCPLASMENLRFKLCYNRFWRILYFCTKWGKKHSTLNLTPSESHISLYWFLTCFSVSFKCYIDFI